MIKRTPSTSFQFHYGTIKSNFALSSVKFMFSFNSTMVRLKDSQELN